MAAASTPKLSPTQLRKAYKQDIAAAWELSRKNHLDHTPYAIVLYGVEGGQPPRLWPCVLTEQSLTSVAQRYVDQGHYDTIEEARQALRYSVADSPLIDELEQSTPSVDAVVAPFANTLDDSHYNLIIKPAIAALKELDSQGLFGIDAQRERILLVVHVEDTGEDWMLVSGKQLNPAAVFDRLQADLKIEGTWASSGSIVISRDGHRLYSAGTRHNPDAEPGEDENISEIFGYDIQGFRLKRRWAFEHPGFGDFVLEMELGADQKFLFVLRSQVQSNGQSSLLMCIATDTGQVVREAKLPFDPIALAISADGQKLALGTRKGPVQIIDSGSFETVATHELPKPSRRLCFLESNSLLTSTDAGLMRIAVDAKKPVEKVNPLRTFYLSTDAKQTLLAVCRLGNRHDILSKEPVKEFGVDLLNLADFSPAGTIVIPGYQVGSPTLSKDGELLALVAMEIEKERKYIVVFNVKTGQEIGRRKAKFEKTFEFLPDNQTLAFGTSGFTTTEPIEFWRV